MAVNKAIISQDIQPPMGSIKSQSLFLLTGLLVITVLAVAWLAVSSIEMLGRSAMDIAKMAAVDPLVINEIRESTDQNLRTFVFLRVLPATILILGITLAVGIIGMNRIVGPLRQLVDWSRRIRQGGELIIKEQASGEIGLLANELMAMVEQFRQQQAALAAMVQQQSQSLEKKTVQLITSAHLAREMIIPHPLEHLLTRSVNLIGDRFGYYHVGIFLLDPGGQYAVLRAAYGDAGQKMLAMPHHLKVAQSSIVGYVASTGLARVVPDVELDAAYFRNPLLPETCSEIALPLRISQRIIGVLDIQCKAPTAFSEEDVLVLQALADQVSAAIDKLHYLEQYQEALAKLEQGYGPEQLARRQSRLQVRTIDGYAYDLTGVEPFMVGETKEDQERQPIGNLLRIPLTVRGEVVATLDLWSERESLTAQERRLLDEILDRLSQAIESAQLFEETQFRVKREQMLSQFVTNLSRSMDLDTILQQAVKELAKLPDVNQVSIVLQPAGAPDTSVIGESNPVKHNQGGGETSLEGTA